MLSSCYRFWFYVLLDDSMPLLNLQRHEAEECYLSLESGSVQISDQKYSCDRSHGWPPCRTIVSVHFPSEPCHNHATLSPVKMCNHIKKSMGAKCHRKGWQFSTRLQQKHIKQTDSKLHRNLADLYSFKLTQYMESDHTTHSNTNKSMLSVYIAR
jgi:hypothetical protein